MIKGQMLDLVRAFLRNFVGDHSLLKFIRYGQPIRILAVILKSATGKRKPR